jgi:hypothetical protein
MDIRNMEKMCRKCGVIKSFAQFGRQAKSKDGTKNYCKECISDINRERYASNREKHKTQVKDWQKENPDKVREYKRKYASKKKEL